MSNPSTTIILPAESPADQPPEHAPKASMLDAFFQRDRLWLLIIILIIAALFLGGCHARSECCQPSSCGSSGSSNADGVLAVFYVAYILVWIIASAAGG